MLSLLLNKLALYKTHLPILITAALYLALNQKSLNYITPNYIGNIINTTATAQEADITPPYTSYTQTPEEPNGKNDWFVTSVRFDLLATDLESGVKEINYRVTGGPWQKATFSNTQNHAPNASFETTDIASSSGLAQWEATIIDLDGTYTQGATNAPGFPNRSAQITATGGAWHGINHKAHFVPTTPYDNMTASVWLKTENVPGGAYFKVFAVLNDGVGGHTYAQIGQSAVITGTTGWKKLSYPFAVNYANAAGVYIDIGLSGPGTLWADAVNINSSVNSTQTNVTIALDNANHRIEFYSVDNVGNIETYSCNEPKKNCIDFKLDQTPPGNWYNSGAFRQIPGPSAHHLYVHTNVQDNTSGLSTLTNKYQYKTVASDTLGIYSNLAQCNSTWLPGQWATLGESVATNGVNDAYLETQHTNFCNNDWRECKTVAFYAEDVAGNSRTKDYCINGPWIRVRGGATVRSNSYIDMIAEAIESNTDGLLDVGGNAIDFFSTSVGWRSRNNIINLNYSYDDLWNITTSKTTLASNASLPTASGVFYWNNDVNLTNTNTPSNYSTATFNQIIFINGNLRVTRDITVANASTALYIVKGNVEIDKSVDEIGFAIITDGNFYTAYNIGARETTKTLDLNGFYSANSFVFQRTLQGTNNNNTPSENFIYEPKYLIQLAQFFNNSSVTWKYE